MRGALLLPVLGLGGCFRTEGFECTFRDEAVAEFHLQLWVASWSADGDLEWLVLDQARSLGLSGRVIKEREKMA